MIRQSLAISIALAVVGVLGIGSATAFPSTTADRTIVRPLAYKPPPVTTYTTCKVECMSPTGKYLVCRSNLDRHIVSEKLIDINACMH